VLFTFLVTDGYPGQIFEVAWPFSSFSV